MNLMVDVIFFKGVDFFNTLSSNIILFSAKHVPYNMEEQLSNYFKKIVKLYYWGIFFIQVILMDVELEKVESNLGLIQVDPNSDW